VFFYQAMDLPGLGSVPGVWDHRGTEDVYLARTDLRGMTALDVGPANGFWTFEMERRGASVTVIELGDDNSWDMVPHGGKTDHGPRVTTVHQDFLTAHEATNSSAKIVRGTVYDTPDIVDHVDISVMGNILQHLRDPFRAIEKVAQVTEKRLIISESIWTGTKEFLNQAQLQLIPRSHTPLVNHSWYQVSPVFVGEVLLLLGFKNLRCEMHKQKFNGTAVDGKPRMVPHFTYSGDR
jgi:hypothetical protein